VGGLIFQVGPYETSCDAVTKEFTAIALWAQKAKMQETSSGTYVKVCTWGLWFYGKKK